jgi:soluble lytic murein transglycosylase-like protein
MKSKIRNSIRRKRRLYKLIFLIILVIPLFTYGSVYYVDKVNRLDYPDLPTQEVRNTSDETSQPIQIPKYDIPLSAELQEFTYEKSIQYDVDYIMVLAIMQKESGFRPDLVSESGDYGLMQINESNHQYLRESLGITDFLDPKQNIEAGVFFLSGIYENNTDPERILMVYNMGGRIAQGLWDLGRESTGYSRGVMRAMDEIRERRLTI